MTSFPQELIRQREVHTQLGMVRKAKQLAMEALRMERDMDMEVRSVLIDDFECTDEQIAPKSRLRQDLGLDEYDVMDFAEELEARLSIPIPVEEITAVQTVQEVVDLLTKKSQ